MSATKPARGTRDHLAWLIDWVRRCAEDLKQPVHRLRHRDFLEWAIAEEGGPSARPSRGDVDAYAGSEGRGAWPNIIAYAADEGGDYEEPDRAQLGMVRELVKTNQHRRKLERLVGDEERASDRLARLMVEAIERTPPVISKINKLTIPAHVPSDTAIVAHLSDTHFGSSPDPEEVLGGRYNWEIAARRMGLFAWQIGEFKREKNRDRVLHLVVNGDGTEGVIHPDDRGIDMLSVQLDGQRQILTHFIDHMRTKFARVHVHCTTGNHGRWVHRDNGRRPTSQKYDSADMVVYRSLEAIFRSFPDVVFDIPKTPFCIWDVCGHRFLATHGDSVLSLGQPSKNLKFDALFSKLYHLESNEALGGQRFAAICLGHYHHPMVCRIPGRSPQPYLTINGAASGRSAFSQSYGFASSPPSQTMWETTSEHAIGDFRIVDLERADDDPQYSLIIPTPTPLGQRMPKTNALVAS
jgi:hypothetical protein